MATLQYQLNPGKALRFVATHKHPTQPHQTPDGSVPRQSPIHQGEDVNQLPKMMTIGSEHDLSCFPPPESNSSTTLHINPSFRSSFSASSREQTSFNNAPLSSFVNIASIPSDQTHNRFDSATYDPLDDATVSPPQQPFALPPMVGTGTQYHFDETIPAHTVATAPFPINTHPSPLELVNDYLIKPVVGWVNEYNRAHGGLPEDYELAPPNECRICHALASVSDQLRPTLMQFSSHHDSTNLCDDRDWNEGSGDDNPGGKANDGLQRIPSPRASTNLTSLKELYYPSSPVSCVGGPFQSSEQTCEGGRDGTVETSLNQNHHGQV